MPIVFAFHLVRDAGSNSVPSADNQELARRDSQRDEQNPLLVLDTELQKVISAWDKMPSALKVSSQSRHQLIEQNAEA